MFIYFKDAEVVKLTEECNDYAFDFHVFAVLFYIITCLCHLQTNVCPILLTCLKKKKRKERLLALKIIQKGL